MVTKLFTLIFSYSVVKLNNFVSRNEIFEGIRSTVLIDVLKRISIKNYDKIIHNYSIDLNLWLQKMPIVITIFNMIFEVKPSIRSLVQYNRCPCFGHAQKYCCNKLRCYNCGEVHHSKDICSSIQATDSICLYYKQLHLQLIKLVVDYLLNIFFNKQLRKISPSMML